MRGALLKTVLRNGGEEPEPAGEGEHPWPDTTITHPKGK